MTGKVERELNEVTGVKIKKGEDRQDYLKRLADEIEDLPDKSWEGLSTDAANWANSAQTAVTAKKDIPDFTKDEDEDAEEEKPKSKVRESANAKDKQEATVKSSKKDKAEKADKPSKSSKSEKPEKAEKAEKPEKSAKPKPTEGGVKWKIKKMLIKNPKLSTDDLVERLSKSGEKLSKLTVAAMRAEFRHTVKVLNAEGVTSINLD